MSMIRKEGYDECTRGNGSKFYLCQLCLKIAHIESSEEGAITHLVEVHHMK